jgi:hypothetical protein
MPGLHGLYGLRGILLHVLILGGAAAKDLGKKRSMLKNHELTNGILAHDVKLVTEGYFLLKER